MAAGLRNGLLSSLSEMLDLVADLREWSKSAQHSSELNCEQVSYLTQHHCDVLYSPIPGVLPYAEFLQFDYEVDDHNSACKLCHDRFGAQIEKELTDLKWQLTSAPGLQAALLGEVSRRCKPVMAGSL